MVAGFHQMEHVREQERQAREDPEPFYSLILEVASHYFCHTLFIRKKSPGLATFPGGGLHEGINIRKQDGGPPWKLPAADRLIYGLLSVLTGLCGILGRALRDCVQISTLPRLVR